jgi:hypothetical protein
MNKSSPLFSKRNAIKGQITAGTMALIGFGMFLGAFIQGESLTGTAFSLAWALFSIGISITLFWSVIHLRLARKR